MATEPEPFETRAERLALRILRFYRVLRRTTDLPWSIADQMLRAGTGIGANLEEAKSAYSRREKAAKQNIALRESRECRYWLRLIVADQPQTAREAGPLAAECSEFVAMLTVSVRSLRRPKRETAVLVLLPFLLFVLFFWL